MAASMRAKSASTALQTFTYCAVCRHSHDQGKRHAFTRSHRDKIKHMLRKFDAKVKLARQDMREPCIVAGSFEPDTKYWCYMCGCEVKKHVTDGEVTVRHAGFIEHLMSSEHGKQVDRFWRVNRIATDLQSKFVFSSDSNATYKKAVEDALRKHDEEQQRMTSESASKIRRLESNRSQMLQQSSSSTHGATETVASIQYQITPSRESGPRPMSSSRLTGEAGSSDADWLRMEDMREIPQCSSWSDPSTRQANSHPVNTPIAVSGHNQKDLVSSSSNQYTTSKPQMAGQQHKPGVLNRVKTVGVISSGGLSVINVKARGISGNIHSGAHPPWLVEDSCNRAECRELGPSEDDYRKHLERQRKSKLNPGRVGANFDHGSLSNDDWLPSFGRVWNAGRRWQSRRQYRKEVNNTRPSARQTNP